MVASIQPACLVYRVQMRPAFIHPRIDVSGRLANLKASATRSRNQIRFNHARFNSVQQQTLPAASVADIFGRCPVRLRKWPNSSSELRDAISQGKLEQLYVWYVHNVPESDNCKQELTTVAHNIKGVLQNIAPTNTITVIDDEIGANKLAVLYDDAERTIRITDEIEFTS